MHVYCLFTLVFELTQAVTVDYASPLVFDPQFYVNTNPDLGNPTTVQAARHHWLHHGISQGRQACGQFHTKQYIDRYPDIAKAYGNDYHAAIKHYLTFGQTEHRFGYVEGGYGGRYTISRNNQLFLSASARMGGAIDSLVWNQIEYVNDWDHGRQIQMAVNAIPYAECFNPTEAGGSGDYRDATTKSVLENVTASGHVLKTTVLPAFWIRANGHETHNATPVCHRGSPSINTEDTYSHRFSKTVTLGCFDLDNCIKYESKFVIAGKWPKYDFINLSAPVIYLTANFTVVYNYNPNNDQLEPKTHHTLPVVVSTPDHQYAMGVYAPSGQDSDKFMYYSTGTHAASQFQDFAWKINTATVVFRKNELPYGSTNTFNYVSYMCVGNLNMAAQCMRTLHRLHPHI